MKHILILTFFCLFFACTPKVAEVVSEPEVVEVVEKERLTPCTTFNDLDPSERDEVENAFVFYRDFMTLGRYESALKPWRYSFIKAPGSNGVVKRHFQDGIKIYMTLIKDETDRNIKVAYLDTIQMIVDKRVECFGEDAEFVGKVAFDYYYNHKDLVGEEKIFALFEKSLKMSDGPLPYFVVNPFTKLLHDKVQNGTIDFATARSYARKIDQTIKDGLANCKGDQCESWEIINEYAPARLLALEGVDGFYDCEYYLDRYYKEFQSSPDDCKVIKRAYSRLLRGGCAESLAQVVEIKAAKDTKCFVPPPPPGKLKQAYDAYSSGRYKEAVDLFVEVADEKTEPEKKSKYYFLASQIYYADIKNYPQSRKYALKAAEHRAGWGAPYLLIGKLYASSGPLCGPGRGWDSQIVTWPAIDKFAYAKKVDPSVAAEADKLIRTYRQYMPKKEDIFFRQIKAGSTFKVPCWIQESTIVRTAD